LGVEEEFFLVDLKTRQLTARAPELPQAALHSLMARVVQRVHQLDVDAQPRLLTLVQSWFGSEAFPQAEERNAVFGTSRGAGPL
jgi:hypothetical protein